MEISCIENPNCVHALVPPLHMEKKPKSQFLVEFQHFLNWQFYVVLGKFGQIWANFATLAMANSMPEFHLKSLKPHNF
jgi:hypothetical protein